MSLPLAESATGWENRLLKFLRQELAPSPARWRASLRLTVLCVLATLIAMACRIPDAAYLLMFLLSVGQPDASLSLRKAWLRGLAVLIGGSLAILSILTLGDMPGLRIIVQSLVIALTLFLSRTTTVPYAAILAGFTFLLVLPTSLATPEASLSDALHRMLLAALDAGLGTVGLLSLWPDDPEKLLLDDLSNSLKDVESRLASLLEGWTRRAGMMHPVPHPLPPRVSNLAAQLDLLRSIEGRSQVLRQRHAEQMRLITSLELLTLEVRRLEQFVADAGGLYSPTPSLHGRIRQALEACRRIRRAFELNRPAGGPDSGAGSGPPSDSITPARILSVMEEIERLLDEIGGSTGFLGVRPPPHPAETGPRPPIATKRILTPDCTLANIEAVQFGLKGSLAAALCYLLYQGLNWPGIAVCVAICVIVAQHNVGAGIRKSLVSFSGVVVGGLVSLGVIVVLMPNLTGLGSWLAVMGAVYFGIAWLASGGPRIFYVGMQMGFLICIVLLSDFGPSEDLLPARDRIIGVLTGIAVMAVVDAKLWPRYAGPALARKIRECLSGLSAFQRSVASGAWTETGHKAFGVHRDLASALNLYEESLVEPGQDSGREAGSESRVLQLTGRLQTLFMALVAAARQRHNLDLELSREPWISRMTALNAAILEDLESLEAAAEGRQPTPAAAGQALAVLKEALEAGTTLTRAEAWDLREYLASCEDLVEMLNVLRSRILPNLGSVMPGDRGVHAVTTGRIEALPPA